jgi:23S rRNA (adenine2503-C2)-methyltransferase
VLSLAGRMPAEAPTLPDLRDLDLAELEAFALARGESRFRGEQLFRWVHGQGATAFEQMTNLARPTRERLAQAATIGTLTVDTVQTSQDGTRKLRLMTRDGHAIESVLIPDGDKTTQCISSQVGCAIDCDFCATAKLGLARQLTPGEIVDQVYRGRALLAEVEPGRRLTNIVYMGMGEPMHNFPAVAKSVRLLTHDLGAGLSARRITISTAGLVPGIARLGSEELGVGLAISLNATTDEVRDRIMPINKKWNIAALLAAVRAFPLERRRRVTFEYVLLAGVNDSVADARRLAQLLRGMPCKVNVIPWNPHPGSGYARPSQEAIDGFQNAVKQAGLAVYLRTPRGDDIDAACGQLAARPSADAAIVPLRPRKPRVVPAPV